MKKTSIIVLTVLSMLCLAPTPPPARSTPRTEPPPQASFTRRPAEPSAPRPAKPKAPPQTAPKKEDENPEDPQLIIRSRDAEIRALKQKVQDQQNEIDSLNDKLIEAENALGRMKATTQPAGVTNEVHN